MAQGTMTPDAYAANLDTVYSVCQSWSGISDGGEASPVEVGGPRIETQDLADPSGASGPAGQGPIVGVYNTTDNSFTVTDANGTIHKPARW